MPDFSFLHAADIHLDSPLYGLERYEGAPAEEIRDATRRAFERLIECAIDRRVGFLLLAGDLYDGDCRDYKTVLFLVRCMQRLHDAGIRAFIVAGNHDAESENTKTLRLPSNVHVFETRWPETVTLEDLGVAIHGQGFRTKVVTDDLSAAYPARRPGMFNVGLLHTSLDGRPGHAPYAPCSIAGLRSKGYDYWALGHIHKRDADVSVEPRIVFPGNLQGRDARETGPKGATLVSVVGGVAGKPEFVACDVMRWAVRVLDVTGCAKGEDVLETVRQDLLGACAAAEGRMLAIRIRLTGTPAAHSALRRAPERWTNEVRALAGGLRGAGAWIEKVEIATRRPLDAAALDGLLRTVHALPTDDALLARMAAQLADLSKKLRAAGVIADDDSTPGGGLVDPTGAGALRGAIEDARELLLARLLAGGATE